MSYKTGQLYLLLTGEVRKIFSSCPRGGGLWIHRPPSPEEGDRKRIFQGRLQKRQGTPPMSAQRGEPFFPSFLPSAGNHLGEREGKSREKGSGHEEISINQLVPVGIFLREHHGFFISPSLKPDGFHQILLPRKRTLFFMPRFVYPDQILFEPSSAKVVGSQKPEVLKIESSIAGSFSPARGNPFAVPGNPASSVPATFSRSLSS
jgi:hypothetical protein